MGIFGTIWKGIKGVGNMIFGDSGGGVSAASSIISNKQQLGYQKDLMNLQYKYNTQAAKNSFNYSKQLQDYQNQYTSKMASSAHQIEVDDLRKAGLNPILSATGGSGASVPAAGGATINENSSGLASAPEVKTLADVLAYKMNKAQRRQMEFQNDKTNAETGTEIERQQTQEAQTEMIHKQRELFEQQIDDLRNQIKNRDAMTAINTKRYDTMNKADLMNAITNQIVGSANAYYQRNRALGFGSSWSGSDSDNRDLGIFGIKTGRGWSSNTSYSRNW